MKKNARLFTAALFFMVGCQPAPTPTLVPTPALPSPTSVPPTITLAPPTPTAIPVTPTLVPAPQTPAPSATKTALPRETPDATTLREYFNELYLTNAQPTTLFKTDDKICLVLDTRKPLSGSASIYDVVNRTEVKNAPFQLGMPSVFQFCSLFGSPRLALPAGRYEYKIRVANDLAAVLPLQVQTPESGPVALSEQPDRQLFQDHFNNLYLSNMSPTSEFGVGDQFALYRDIKKTTPPAFTDMYDVDRQALLLLKAPYQGSPDPGISFGFINLLRIGPAVSAIRGRYEFRVWLGEVLIAALPFQVR